MRYFLVQYTSSTFKEIYSTKRLNLTICVKYVNSTAGIKLHHKVKTQYVHCRLFPSYFLFPWRNPA